MYEPMGEKPSRGDQGQRNVMEGREKSGYKIKREGDGRGGVERVLKSVRREERDGGKLLIDVVDVVAAFSDGSPCKLAAHFLAARASPTT